ncbi:ABC transporter substrate-binding protein [Pelagibius sp. CAU 1746]|uniref:substrate-binding periplasmic protein n=1 Tax=Pelagibius sp. CAU 1746 TaxID=3140370 RepID=UPI00325B5284
MRKFLRLGLIVILPAWANPANADDACPVFEAPEIAAEDAWFPYSGLYEGELRGISLDIISAAYHAVGCKVRFLISPYARCRREVEAGRQVGCFNTSNSPENLKLFIFHQEPLFQSRLLVYAHPERGSDFKVDDIAKGTVAIVRGYTYTDELDANTSINKINVESDLQTLALVARKRADFALVYEKVAKYHISRNARRIDPAPVPILRLAEVDLFISFSKRLGGRSTELAELLDQGLREIRRDGTYANIDAEWDHWLNDGIRRGEPAPHWQPVAH